MTTLTDAIARAEQAQADLSKAIAEARKGKEEWPKAGGRVWCVNANGIVVVDWDGGNWDKNAIARGNVYRTQAEAERADQRRIVEAELRKMAREKWTLRRFPEWYELRRDGGSWIVVACELRSPSDIRFPTRESAQAAIYALGDRLDLLLDEGA